MIFQDLQEKYLQGLHITCKTVFTGYYIHNYTLSLQNMSASKECAYPLLILDLINPLKMLHTICQFILRIYPNKTTLQETCKSCKCCSYKNNTCIFLAREFLLGCIIKYVGSRDWHEKMATIFYASQNTP